MAAASILSSPPGGDPKVPVQAGLGGDDAAQLGPLGGGELAGVLDHLVELGEHALADLGIALGGLGVVADHEPFRVADLDFLDPQILRHVLVAALPGQRGAGLGR